MNDLNWECIQTRRRAGTRKHTLYSCCMASKSFHFTSPFARFEHHANRGNSITLEPKVDACNSAFQRGQQWFGTPYKTLWSSLSRWMCSIADYGRLGCEDHKPHVHRAHDQSRVHIGVILLQDFNEYPLIFRSAIHYPYEIRSA